MSYHVKEIYYTLQGEGAHTGRPAVFLRFTGCNLWTGREVDRATAICNFCDTDFVGTDGPGGGRFESAEQLASAVEAVWQSHSENPQVRPFVVATGGEPLLQLDEAAITALHDVGFEIAVETNGTVPVPAQLDWVSCSPKAGADFVVKKGDELKLVFPQEHLEPADFLQFEFDHFFLQPMDGPRQAENTELAVEYCRRHPPWVLSLQTHKILGIP